MLVLIMGPVPKNHYDVIFGSYFERENFYFEEF